METHPVTRAGIFLAMTLPFAFVDESDAADRLPPSAGLAGRSVTIAPHGMVCAMLPQMALTGHVLLPRGSIRRYM